MQNRLFHLFGGFLLFCPFWGNSQSLYVSGQDLAICQTQQYLPQIQSKRLGLVVNQSSVFPNGTHLVDSLLRLGCSVTKIFAPEHGFRGNADAGEHLTTTKDSTTNIPIISLYGTHYKPSLEDLEDVDVLIFDIQDVGVRFYTYISTLHYVMESSAYSHKPLYVFDRPNPNIHFVDGPVLESNFRSFVGMHPVPIVYGMTIGEYATMINGEEWLLGGVKSELHVVKLQQYNHQKRYKLPVRPSPNLPNELSILLYPTLCLFEGTEISVGRGTTYPFQVLGHPDYPESKFSFIPQSILGMSKEPPYKGRMCYGKDYRSSIVNQIYSAQRLDLSILLETYSVMNNKKYFFNSFFDKLAGTSMLRTQIIQGKTEEEIRNSWQFALEEFKQIRKKYLLYP